MTGMETPSATSLMAAQSAVALIELLPRAPVHRHGRDPERGSAPGQFGGVAGRVIPAEAHLHGDRARHRRHGCPDDVGRVVEVAHQGGSRIAAGDALGRAAHIDVDHGRAGCLRQTRRLAHPARVAASELDHVGRDARPFGAQPRLLRAEDEIVRGDHLGDDEGRAAPLRNPAKDDVGDARQRGQHGSAVESDRANRPSLTA